MYAKDEADAVSMLSDRVCPACGEPFTYTMRPYVRHSGGQYSWTESGFEWVREPHNCGSPEGTVKLYGRIDG